MSKYRFTLNLQMFAEEAPAADAGAAAPTGADSAPAAGEQQIDSPTGVDDQAAAEPEKMNNFEKAFAKRLAAEREKWQQENAEKYKHHDDYRTAAEFLQKSAGLNDIISLKEQIELANLQERAAQQNVPVEVMKRLNELEQKAAVADQLQNQQQEERVRADFQSKIEAFAKEKNVDAMQLWQFMHEKGIPDFDTAFRAFHYDELQKQLETGKKDAVKEYLDSKRAPKAEGSGSAGAINPPPPKTWEESRQRAIERIRAANNPE